MDDDDGDGCRRALKCQPSAKWLLHLAFYCRAFVNITLEKIRLIQVCGIFGKKKSQSCKARLVSIKTIRVGFYNCQAAEEIAMNRMRR